MSRAAWLVVGAVGCHGGAGDAPAPVAALPPVAAALAPTPPVFYGCGADVPAGACTAYRAAVERIPRAAWTDPPAPDASTLTRCAFDAPSRAGAWTYALVAPLYTPAESQSAAQLAALWAGSGKIALAASADTQAALAPVLGAGHVAELAPDARPTIDATHWAIVRADELSPAWKVLAVDGHFPLETDGDQSPLTIPLCSPGPAVHDVDPAQLTILAMTGTTAMTRFMSQLLDSKGTTYPARDIAPWFAGADFVHVSNEVSFVPGCDQAKATMAFCSRESYIELLEAIHANVIELDGSHLSDYGTKWIPHTLDMYAARGWHWFGGGRDQLEGSRPLELEHHGNKLAFVGCNMPKTTSHVVWNVPGVAACDLRRIAWQVADLRARGVFPIVSIQHEEVYVHDPPDVIVADFRHLAALGAGIVFGSQAHCAHPWEVDHGAFLHYGAGNFFFDQESATTRDGAVDRFYLYRGRLLTVGHLFTRLEENGRPRPLTDGERAGFLGEMTTALAKLRRADPWAAPTPVALGPLRPDSVLIGNHLQPMYVYVPRDAAPGAQLPLVIDLHGGGLRGGPLERLQKRGRPAAILADPSAQHVIVASPHLEAGASWSKPRIAAIQDFLVAKYAVDPAQITVVQAKD